MATTMEVLNSLSLNDIRDLDDSLPYGLTLFEVLRTPRIANPANYQGNQATLNESGLREEISCPICSGILVRCVVIKTCLHRFCSTCIQKCVRIGLHECPKCRKHVPSRRFLKADPIYDSIISRIVTNVEVFEQLSDAFTVALNKGLKNDPNIQIIRNNYLNENPKRSIDDVESFHELNLDGYSIQSKFDRRIYLREFKKKRALAKKSLPKPNDFNKLLFKLKTDDSLPQIEPNGLCCDGSFTVHQLSVHIKSTLKLPPDSNISIHLKESDYVPEPNVTLAYLRNKVCIMSHEVLNIYYGTLH